MSDESPPPAGATRRRIPRRTAILVLLAVAAAGLYVGNSSRLAGPGPGRPFLLAHRGLAQTFDLAGATNDTCTAGRIHPPRHGYLENTLAGMRAAFEAGADAVEFDVQRTADDRLAVFHDATLECRTDGRGKVRDHPLATLRRLDLGYGYTADGGATFPLRGRGVGLLPTAEEVVAAFPGRELLLHIKGADPAEGEAVARYLATLPADRLATVTVYGGDEAVDVVATRLPGLRVTSKKIMTDCLVRYLAAGWTGYVPRACRHRQLHLPHVYGRWLWGWPHRFERRMRAADTRVVTVAGSGGFSAGFDRPADLADLPAGYTGGIWTNQVDVVAPLLRR